MHEHVKTRRKVKRQVNRLLAFLDCLQEALRVKLEILHAYPQLLEYEQRDDRADVSTLIEASARAAQHVKVLARTLARFGATCELTPVLSPGEGESSMKRQWARETLYRHILEECRRHLQHHWQDTSLLKRTLAEQIEMLLAESTRDLNAFRTLLESPDRLGRRLFLLHQTVAAL